MAKHRARLTPSSRLKPRQKWCLAAVTQAAEETPSSFADRTQWENINVAYENIRRRPRSGGISFGRRSLRRRPGNMQASALRRCRLDRHHRHHRDGLGHPRSARLRAGRAGAVGAGHLHLAQEQGCRRLPRQLDADHGSRHKTLSRRQVGRDGRDQPRRREIYTRRAAAHL